MLSVFYVGIAFWLKHYIYLDLYDFGLLLGILLTYWFLSCKSVGEWLHNTNRYLRFDRANTKRIELESIIRVYEHGVEESTIGGEILESEWRAFMIYCRKERYTLILLGLTTAVLQYTSLDKDTIEKLTIGLSVSMLTTLFSIIETVKNFVSNR